MVGLDWQVSGKMVVLKHVSFDYFHSGMDGFKLNFLKCGKGAGPVLSEGLFRAWLKPSSAFLAWLCLGEYFSGQWMMWLKRGSSKASGWSCRLCVGARGEGWDPPAQSPRCAVLLAAWWVQGERTFTGGYPPGLFHFYFHGSPHKIMISLKCRGWGEKKGPQTFCRTGKYFPPSS